VGVLPEFAVEAELASGAVAPVTPRPPLPSIVLSALVRRGEAPSPVVEDLLASLRADPDR
jgi:DNA-binding transcriptional LysR family regulator